MSALSDFMERVTAERDAMSKTIEEWKAASGYDDLLAAYSAAFTELDALRAEVERLRRLCGSEADDAAHYEARERERRITAAAQSLHKRWKTVQNEAHMPCTCGAATNPDICVCPKCFEAWVRGNGVEFLDRVTAGLRNRMKAVDSAPWCRLLAACQSLHRAWKRERDLVERYQRDHDEWMWSTDTCDCAICDEVRDRKSLRSDARDGIVTRLRAFVDTLRADGLDIDDPDTAPVWTGKIHDSSGRLLFDLATARAGAPTPYSAICHHQTRPDCAGCPDDAVCEASGRAPRGAP